MKRGVKGVFSRKSSGSSASKFAEQLWDKYKDPKNEESIGPEGVERFCEDVGLDPTDVLVLVFAWQLEAARMGYFSKDEWFTGLAKLRVSSLPEVKPALQAIMEDLAAAAKSNHHDQEAFRDFYGFAHKFSRDDNKKNVDTATACALLGLIMAPIYPKHTEQFSRYLQKIDRMHGINQDEWMCFWELSRAIKEDCSDYADDGAWPILLDEYVEWVQGGCK